MDDKAKEEITVEGVTVDIRTCGHCDRNPTREEIVASVKRAQANRACPQFHCAYCGKTVKATRYSMYHDSQGWSAHEKTIEPSITINQIHTHEGPPIHHHNGLHLECVSKSMPFLNGFTPPK